MLDPRTVGTCTGGLSLIVSGPAVQEGDDEESNSKLGAMMLDMIDGFFFVLNGEGVLKFVSKNVHNYLNFEEVLRAFCRQGRGDE